MKNSSRLMIPVALCAAVVATTSHLLPSGNKTVLVNKMSLVHEAVSPNFKSELRLASYLAGNSPNSIISGNVAFAVNSGNVANALASGNLPNRIISGNYPRSQTSGAQDVALELPQPVMAQVASSR